MKLSEKDAKAIIEELKNPEVSEEVKQFLKECKKTSEQVKRK
jgi:DNA-binding transcriptional regulator YhcF (GntR family)